MYWLVSPFSSKNNGISNYCSLACELLKESGVEAEIIENPDGLNVKDFEALVLDTIKSGDVVEVPDAWGLLAKSKKSGVLHHTRLHAPSKLLQQINGARVNEVRYLREMQSALNAEVISSPSLANAIAYDAPEFQAKISVYPNPCIATVDNRGNKEYDYIFIGRPDSVKGFDYLVELIFLMPPGRSLLVLGASEEDFFKFTNLTTAANVTFCGWVSNTEKQRLLSLSKVCLVPSRYESFSLVCAEAISHNCEVVAWNVGGLSECFPKEFVRLVQPFDILSFISTAEELLLRKEDNCLSRSEFLKASNQSFVEAIKEILFKNAVTHSLGWDNTTYYPSFVSKEIIARNAVGRFFEVAPPKVFGFSMMNEHAEQMWGALNSVFKDYRYVSRKALGYNDKFGYNFPIESTKFFVNEWRFDHEELKKLYRAFDPDLMFIFNGNTDQFVSAKQSLLSQKDVGVVYSELGWLPQKGYIYFDRKGANAESYLSSQSLESLIDGTVLTKRKVKIASTTKVCLVILQLPGDTTLVQKYFPLALNNHDFVKHVRAAVPSDYEVVVRPHPRDREKYLFKEMDGVRVETEVAIQEQLKNSHSVVLVNSTVVLEAFRFDVNIYTFGYGVFSNKGLTIDCSDGKLASKWEHDIVIPKEKRAVFLSYLKKRQLNVKDFYNSSSLEEYAISLFPIVESYLYNVRTVENRSDVVSVANPISSTKSMKSNKSGNERKGKPRVPHKRKLLNALVKRRKYAGIRLFLKSPLVANYFSELFPMNAVVKRKLGGELEKDFKAIKNVQFMYPNKAFSYYKVRWIYFGVDKALVRYCNSFLVSKLDHAKRLDVCAMLAEAGHETKAVQLAKSILRKKPSLMRTRQYLRVANLVANEDGFMASLPLDEQKYINALAACFNRLASDRHKLDLLMSQYKHNFHIVGNSPVSRGAKRGKLINSTGLVFRFNNYDTSLMRRSDVGFKTDVWVKSPSFDEVSRKDLFNYKAVILTGTNHLDRSPSAYDFFKPFVSAEGLIVGTVPSDLYSNLCSATKAPPSGGVQMMCWLKEVTGKIDPANVSGFSFTELDATKSPEGKVGDKEKYLHNWAIEVNIIKSYLK